MTGTLRPFLRAALAILLWLALAPAGFS